MVVQKHLEWPGAGAGLSYNKKRGPIIIGPYTDETDLFEEVALILLYVPFIQVNGQKPHPL
ncbi:hypothetical protein BHE18_18200 [Rossellomorea aquimaris]|uniref:Uncharacterized protein n=1 Tax=Rossellomorea aquimaris TaxID=189382 RepID=A0A1J6WLK1_9BACI|nr:hypothetical protein BHE18_18200 [Rossellomorea aquimaris]